MPLFAAASVVLILIRRHVIAVAIGLERRNVVVPAAEGPGDVVPTADVVYSVSVAVAVAGFPEDPLAGAAVVFVLVPDDDELLAVGRERVRVLLRVAALVRDDLRFGLTRLKLVNDRRAVLGLVP